MSTLFAQPIRVNVIHAEGDELRMTATTEHGVPKTLTTTAADIQKDLAYQTCRIAKLGSRQRGVVVFNATDAPLPPVSFFVSDAEKMHEADDTELSRTDLERWTDEGNVWVRKNGRPTPRRRHRGAPAREVGHEDPNVGVVDILERNAAARTGAESRQDWDPEAVSRLRPAVTPVEDEAALQQRLDESRARAREKSEADLAAVKATEAETERTQEAPAVPPTVTAMPSLMLRGKHDQSAQDGFRGVLNSMGLQLPPDAAEQYRRERMASILRGWNGTRRVTVANEKGSTGKTPVAMELSSTLALFGRGKVILRDGNPTGNADERGEFTPPLGFHPDGRPFNDLDLALYYQAHGALDDTTMSRFLHYHTSDKYGLVSHFDSNDEDDEMTTDEVEATYKAIAPFASAIVTDTSNAPFDRRDRKVLEDTDQLVVPFLTYPDRENGARKTCTRLENRNDHTRQLVRNGIAVVLTAERGFHHKAVAKSLAKRWEPVVRHVVVVPYDRHMDSTSLRFGDLKDATKSAFLDLGAAVADGFRAA